jgi:hypothetical protein
MYNCEDRSYVQFPKKMRDKQVHDSVALIRPGIFLAIRRYFNDLPSSRWYHPCSSMAYWRQRRVRAISRVWKGDIHAKMFP